MCLYFPDTPRLVSKTDGSFMPSSCKFNVLGRILQWMLQQTQSWVLSKTHPNYHHHTWQHSLYKLPINYKFCCVTARSQLANSRVHNVTTETDCRATDQCTVITSNVLNQFQDKLLSHMVCVSFFPLILDQHQQRLWTKNKRNYESGLK